MKQEKHPGAVREHDARPLDRDRGTHPKPEAEREGLSYKLDRCAHFLYHRHRKDNHGQGKILKILSVSGPMTQKQLQEKLEIQAGSMSEIASKLEGKGLITRTRDKADKRRILLEITEEGRADVARFTEQRKLESRMFDALTQEEQCQLGAMLDRLLASWEVQFQRPPHKGNDRDADPERET